MYFETAENEQQFYPFSKTSTFDKGHGRIEKREYFFATEADWIENYEEWAGLNVIGMVRSTRITDGKESVEDRCRIRKDNSGENLAVIRHIALNPYKGFTNIKLSKAKRFKCFFDDDFLCNAILNKLFFFYQFFAKRY